MKHLATFLLSCLALASTAQNCSVTDCGFHPEHQCGLEVH